MIPDWYEALLLSVAAWRVFQLLAFDDILDRPRLWLLRLGKDWRSPKEYREKAADFLECGYCFGFWVALLWWISWLIFPYETLVATVPFVLSTGVVGVAKLLSSE